MTSTADHSESPPRDALPRPCIVSIREGEHEPGWLGRRFGDSWRVAKQVWRERRDVRRSMLRWSAIGLALLAAAVAYLGSGTQLPRAVIGAAAAFGWAFAWLFFIGIHLSGVRDSQGNEKPKLGLPNGLTMLRVVMIPAVTWAVVAHQRLMDHAALATLIIFLVGFSDVLDGLIARLMRWETILGRNLDHMADVQICSFLAIAEYVAGLMPGWLMGLIVFRYMGAGLGGILSVMYLPNARIKPSWIGRLCTAVVGMTLFLTIAQPLLAPSQRENMIYLFVTSGVLLVGNVVGLIVMAVQGIAVERLQTGERSPKGASDNSSATPR